jgi:hypothetical protein
MPIDRKQADRIRVAVVVPVYTAALGAAEQIAARQCVTVLNRHPTFVIAPEGLDVRGLPFLGQLPVETFARRFFDGFAGYNSLMLSPSFYERFLKLGYDYILIHQLDAFVFDDRVMEWCAKGYDYVGAPWAGISIPGLVWNSSRKEFVRKIPAFLKLLLRGKLNYAVGNGGLSLRRTESCIRYLQELIASGLTPKFNEDLFWLLEVVSRYRAFRTPGWQEALGFAFEMNPARCFELNRGKLPFGCHAWHKHDADFWRPIFARLGYAI